MMTFHQKQIVLTFQKPRKKERKNQDQTLHFHSLNCGKEKMQREITWWWCLVTTCMLRIRVSCCEFCESIFHSCFFFFVSSASSLLFIGHVFGWLASWLDLFVVWKWRVWKEKTKLSLTSLSVLLSFISHISLFFHQSPMYLWSISFSYLYSSSSCCCWRRVF